MQAHRSRWKAAGACVAHSPPGAHWPSFGNKPAIALPQCLSLPTRCTPTHPPTYAQNLPVSPAPAAQAELEAILFSVMRSKGFGDEFINRYRMVNQFFQQKRPLVILICGSACTGAPAGGGAGAGRGGERHPLARQRCCTHATLGTCWRDYHLSSNASLGSGQPERRRLGQ